MSRENMTVLRIRIELGLIPDTLIPGSQHISLAISRYLLPLSTDFLGSRLALL
jgi:hypothetical protein